MVDSLKSEFPNVEHAGHPSPFREQWQRLRDAYGTVVKDKLAWLHRAHILLVVSFAAVLALLIALVFLPAAPASGPAQMIILTPTPLSTPAP